MAVQRTKKIIASVASRRRNKAANQNPNKQRIEPHFKHYWRQKNGRSYVFKYREIAAKITHEHHYPVTERELKKWRKQWHLPSRNAHHTEVEAAWEALNCPSLEDLPSEREEDSLVPIYKIRRWLKKKQNTSGAQEEGDEVQTIATNENRQNPSDLDQSDTIEMSATAPETLADILAGDHASEIVEQGAFPEHGFSLDLDEGAPFGVGIDGDGPRAHSPVEEELRSTILSHNSGLVEIDVGGFCSEVASTRSENTVSYDSSLLGTVLVAETTAMCPNITDDIGMQATFPYVQDSDASPFLTGYILDAADMTAHNIMEGVVATHPIPGPSWPPLSPFVWETATWMDALCWDFALEQRNSLSVTRWLPQPRTPPTAPQIADLMSWHAYIEFYNAFQLSKDGRYEKSRSGLKRAVLLLAKALYRPSLRVLSHMLLIWFLDWPQCSRDFLKSQLKYLISHILQTSQYNLYSESNLVKFLQAFLTYDVADKDSRCWVSQRLTSRATEANIDDFDGHYDAKEQLINMLVEQSLHDEALKECTELIVFSQGAAGLDCDDTYRAMRKEARVYIKMGLDKAAEAKSLALLQRSKDYKNAYQESAARKEWCPYEDLAGIAQRRGQYHQAKHYTRLALAFSVERYGQTDPNTLRIFNDLSATLLLHNESDDIELLDAQYPRTLGLSKELGDRRQ